MTERCGGRPGEPNYRGGVKVGKTSALEGHAGWHRYRGDTCDWETASIKICDKCTGCEDCEPKKLKLLQMFREIKANALLVNPNLKGKEDEQGKQ